MCFSAIFERCRVFCRARLGPRQGPSKSSRVCPTWLCVGPHLEGFLTLSCCRKHQIVANTGISASSPQSGQEVPKTWILWLSFSYLTRLVKVVVSPSAVLFDVNFFDSCRCLAYRFVFSETTAVCKHAVRKHTGTFRAFGA